MVDRWKGRIDLMGNRRIAGHLAAVFTILIWGTTFISTKVLLNDFMPVEIKDKFLYWFCGGDGWCFPYQF